MVVTREIFACNAFFPEFNKISLIYIYIERERERKRERERERELGIYICVKIVRYIERGNKKNEIEKLLRKK